MRILMLGNSFTTANNLPQALASLTGAEVVCCARGGARLSEQLNSNTRLGSQTRAALQNEEWDYVVLQEMSHGPITAPGASSPAWKGFAGRSGQTGRSPFCSPPGPIRGAGPS